jgi:hypothetical protein
VLDVGLGVGLVTVGLPGLHQQDERRRIGRLHAESQVQQDKRIQVKPCHPGDVEDDPDRIMQMYLQNVTQNIISHMRHPVLYMAWVWR